MSHDLLKKKPTVTIKLLIFIRIRYKTEIIQMTMLPCDYPSSVLLPSTTRYSKVYELGYTEDSIFAILSKLYRVEYICYPELVFFTFFIHFILIWLFNSSRKIYTSNSRQIFVRGITPLTTLAINKIR